MTTPEDLAAQALADLEAKAESQIAAIRAKATEARTRLEQGMLNLESRAVETPAAEDAHAAVPPDLAWEFDPNLEGGADEFGATPPDSLSFGDEVVKPDGVTQAPKDSFADEPIDQFGSEFGGELHIATDDDGIPLGD